MKLNEFAISEDFQEETDSLPVERSWIQESDVYPVTVDLAYLTESQAGSKQLIVHYKDRSGGSFTIRDRMSLTSGHAKGQKNYSVDKKGNKRMLPGMAQANSLAQLTLGKDLGNIDFEMRKVPLYNFEQKAEVPTDVLVPLDMIGKEVQIGVLKVEQNKRAQENGVWVDTNQMQEINVVDKVFSADGRTLIEVKAESEAVFIEKWRDKNQGKTVNRYKPVANSGVPGAPAMPSQTSSQPAQGGQTKPLFNT